MHLSFAKVFMLCKQKPVVVLELSALTLILPPLNPFKDKDELPHEKKKLAPPAAKKEPRPPIAWGPFELHELHSGNPKRHCGFSAHCLMHGPKR